MIDADKIMLIAQLVDTLNQSAQDLETAYNKQDKKRFDQAKSTILDFQTKLSSLLKEKK